MPINAKQNTYHIMLKQILLSLTSLVLMTSCGVNKYEKLQAVGIESSKVGGELFTRLQKNYDRMETEDYQLEKVYWTEEESNGWPADKEGRTILALVSDAKATGRNPLYLKEIVDELPRRLNSRGYMGTIHDNINEQQISGHGWMLRGLCEYYEWTGDKSVMKIARTIVDTLFLPIIDKVAVYPIRNEDRIPDVGEMAGNNLNVMNGWRLSSDIGCVFIGMEGLIHYYKHDKDPKIKALIDELIKLFLRIDLVGIKAQTHASLTALRGLMRYDDLMGEDLHLAEIEKRFALYEQYGMTENYENYNWFDRYNTWSEPCAIIDSYMLAMQLWQKTGKAHYIELAEKIYFNGIGVTQRANGGFGCNIPSGPAFYDVRVRTNEASWCCTMRGAEGLSHAADFAYFRKGNNIYVPFYRENSLEFKDFAMTQTTDYPFGSSVEFKITRDASTEIGLNLFVPSYMRGAKFFLNSEELQPEVKDGFALIQKKFTKADVIRVEYSYKDEIVPAAKVEGMSKIVYGPLVKCINPETGTISPIYHLLDPAVSKESGWRRTVIFPTGSLILQ